MPSNVPLESLTAPLLRSASFPERLSLRFDSYGIEIRSNNPELISWLRDYFQEFLDDSQPATTVIHALEAPSPDFEIPLTVKSPDPGKERIKEEYADLRGGRLVRKRLTGMLFLFGGDTHLAVGPCMENNNQVVNFINNRLIQHRLENGDQLYHAAGVSRGDRGLALAGFSGAGKSSLALHLMNRGLEFISNDRLMVGEDRDGLRMTGIPKQPRVNPGTLLSIDGLDRILPPEDRARFSALPPSELWSLEHKYDLLIHEVYGAGRFRPSAKVTALVILNWKRVTEPAVITQTTAVERPDLLEAVMKSTGVFYLPKPGCAEDRSRDAYIDQLEDCPIFEITGGVDFSRAADLGCDLLASQ